MIECLRDADLYMCNTDTMFQPIIGVKHECFREEPWHDFLKRSLDFQADINYSTAWGRTTANSARHEATERLEKFRKLLYS